MFLKEKQFATVNADILSSAKELLREDFRLNTYTQLLHERLDIFRNPNFKTTLFKQWVKEAVQNIKSGNYIKLFANNSGKFCKFDYPKSTLVSPTLKHLKVYIGIDDNNVIGGTGISIISNEYDILFNKKELPLYKETLINDINFFEYCSIIINIDNLNNIDYNELISIFNHELLHVLHHCKQKNISNNTCDSFNLAWEHNKGEFMNNYDFLNLPNLLLYYTSTAYKQICEFFSEIIYLTDFSERNARLENVLNDFKEFQNNKKSLINSSLFKKRMSFINNYMSNEDNWIKRMSIISKHLFEYVSLYWVLKDFDINKSPYKKQINHICIQYNSQIKWKNLKYYSDLFSNLQDYWCTCLKEFINKCAKLFPNILDFN